MTPRQDNLGERMSGLEARVEGMDKYAHEKWHDLGNTLQPLIALPERITRDIAKIHGQFEGRVSTITRDIERSITAAVEKAIAPVNVDVAELKSVVAELRAEKDRRVGASGVIAAILKSPAIGWIVWPAVTAWAVLTGRLDV